MELKPSEKLIQNFWKSVHKTESCWVWNGVRNNSGYGSISDGHGILVGAHRLSWIIHFGQIPEGLYICHKCDTPYCVNPSHLFTATASDNMLDKIMKGRDFVDNAYRNSKLTFKEVNDIRNLYAEGKITQKELSEKYRVCRSNISYVLKGKSWGHVKDGIVKDDLRSKLSEKQIGEIKSLKGIESQRTIAKRFGISKTHVARLLLSS